jgi:hypothetical protein
MDELESVRKTIDTSDWVGVNRFGTDQQPHSWQELKGEVAEMLRSRVSFDGMSFRIEKFAVNGNKAVAQGTIETEMTLIDRNGNFGMKGRTHRVVQTSRVRDTWVKTADGWRRNLHEKLTPNKFIVDGKTFDPRTQSTTRYGRQRLCPHAE